MFESDQSYFEVDFKIDSDEVYELEPDEINEIEQDDKQIDDYECRNDKVKNNRIEFESEFEPDESDYSTENFVSPLNFWFSCLSIV